MSELVYLSERYRKGHADYVRLRKLGVPTEQIPQRVRDAERVYQAARMRDRRARQRTQVAS